MLYLFLVGGLGNQLFQIFAAISYSLEHNIPFKIKKTKNDKVSPCDMISPRPTYWDNFLKDLSIYTCDDINHIKSMYKELNFSYDKIPYFNNNDFILYGYFQSEKYFKQYYNDIVKMINLDEKKQNIDSNKFNYFSLKNKEIISIHFRIGDYVKLPGQYPIMGIDYYINSLNYIVKNNPDKKLEVLYFKEKKDFVYDKVKKLEKKFPNIKFICCKDGEDWEHLLLMSRCHHNIIANSTFSWFGAYFNDNINKIVCYPEVWFGEHKKLPTIDIFPDKWIKISN